MFPLLCLRFYSIENYHCIAAIECTGIDRQIDARHIEIRHGGVTNRGKIHLYANYTLFPALICPFYLLHLILFIFF